MLGLTGHGSLLGGLSPFTPPAGRGEGTVVRVRQTGFGTKSGAESTHFKGDFEILPDPRN